MTYIKWGKALLTQKKINIALKSEMNQLFQNGMSTNFIIEINSINHFLKTKHNSKTIIKMRLSE